MTRFETLDGHQLGARFFGDKGATLHLTNEELDLLFFLKENTELKSDNMWFGTAGDLLDMWTNGNKSTEEEMMRRFKHEDRQTSLHFKTEQKLLLDENGKLFTGTKFTR